VIAARAAQLASVGAASEAELADAIAAGRIDPTSDELHDVLAAGVAAKLAVANPKHLTQA
jgi:hypothetical protein